jgi:hypothetical protein
MKQYVIDQLRYGDYERIKTYLDQHYGASEVEGLYWIALPGDLATDIQLAHPDCQPFYVAVELSQDRLACELLVRTRHRMRCDCMGYATASQLQWLCRWADAMLETLEIQI